MAPLSALSLQAARRIALAAQGLSGPRPAGPPTRGAVNKTIGKIGLLQIDSVNVLARMHYLPLFSRLGAYAPELLDASAWGQARHRTLFEYWAHEASLLPIDAHPLLRWRMARADRGAGTWSGLKVFARERRAEAEAVLRRIADEGALAASDFASSKGSGGWWGWSEAKSALEWLFWTGRITTSTRRSGFEREYDLVERVLPPEILQTPTPNEADAHRQLLSMAAEALGVASSRDIRDYYRLSPGDAAPRIPELIESGELIPVRVEGWRQEAYVHRNARTPRTVRAKALLAPFDPLIWERSRTEALFGFRYRIEIYTPAHKREHGYYVLPFLLNDALVARVDLKADRQGRRLLVQAAHLEAGAPGDTVDHLAAELRLMALWLGLDDVVAVEKGDAAASLKRVLQND